MANSRTRTILSPYHNWTREDLIARLSQLEQSQARDNNNDSDQSPFAFSSHPRRKIALKFCYSGIEYNGLAFQKSYTPLPTVEGVLFDALARTRLIDPEQGFEGCQWERCGRTDRGVSAAGQVISLWVRSAVGVGANTNNLHDQVDKSNVSSGADSPVQDPHDDLPLMTDLEPPFSSCVQQRDGDVATLEIPYIQVLNRVLPTSIRIICWSPVADTFSARFSCQFRHYKYFFPASPDLDIARVQDAAARLVGTHDFRNLCTLDGSKQIENYHRLVHRAEISPVEASDARAVGGRMHVLDLVGNAFLYNQVRSIMAILFLVGTGLEEPHIVSSLMNVDPRNPLPPFRPGEPVHVVDRKPSYQMADSLPLVLWDCGYSDKDVRWQVDEGGPSISASSSESLTTANLHHQLSSLSTRSRIRATLDDHFLHAAAQLHPLPYTSFPLSSSTDKRLPHLYVTKTVLNIPVGGGVYSRTAKYKPLLERERGESAEVVNERWRQGRGSKRYKERLANQDLNGDSIQNDNGDE